MKRHVAGGECWNFTSTAAVEATNGTDENMPRRNLDGGSHIYNIYIYM